MNQLYFRLTFLLCLLAATILFAFNAEAQKSKKRRKQNKAVSSFTTSRNARSLSMFSLSDDPVKKSGRLFKPGATRPAGGSSLPCPDLKPDVRISSGKTTEAVAYSYQLPPDLTYEPPVQTNAVSEAAAPTTVHAHKPPKPILRPLYFVFDEDELTQEDMETIRHAASYVQHGYKIVIEGHTDSFGDDAYNEKLARRRAERIKAIMMKTTGVSEEAITVLSYGETRPAVPNQSPQSRQLNRRVEIKVVD